MRGGVSSLGRRKAECQPGIHVVAVYERLVPKAV